MCTPHFLAHREPAHLGEAAGCFDAVADAVALMREMSGEGVEAGRDLFESLLAVMAEAQSALRVAIGWAGGPDDPDQARIFDWLREAADRERVFIRRHMKNDDPADPAAYPKIEARIEAIRSMFRDRRNAEMRRNSVLNRLRYHARLIREGTGGEHDWRKVAHAVDELVAEGVPPSSPEIRDILLPILDDQAELDEVPQGFSLALREIDRYLATRTAPGRATEPGDPTAEVVEAARLLKGKAVVLIGGECRPEARRSLEEALGLGRLIWISTREHESIDSFGPHVARPEVALVLLAIRWSSHSFGGVKRFCDRHGKPLVRLPGGYGVNQVAAQILSQCGDRLRAG
jgi:hypothetical protein